MMRIFIIWCVVLSALFISVSFSFAGHIITRLTDNDSDERGVLINNNGTVVWVGRCLSSSEWEEVCLYDGSAITPLPNSSRPVWASLNDADMVAWTAEVPTYSDTEVFLYRDGITIQISNNDHGDYSPRLNNSGKVVWEGFDDEGDVEVFLYDGADVIRLTDNSYDDSHPKINDAGHIVWAGQVGGADWEVFLYEGSLPARRLTDNTADDGFVRINDNGYVVWLHGTAGVTSRVVYLYDGETSARIGSVYDSGAPFINNNNYVVWYENRRVPDTTDWYSEIFLYNGVETTQLTSPPYNKRYPRINARNHIVWQGWDGHDWEIYFFNGYTIRQITYNGTDDQYPIINDDDAIAWLGWDGHDHEVYLARSTEEPPTYWAAAYGGEGGELANAVQPAGDGNYLVAGYTTSFGQGDRDAWLFQCDSGGNIQWQKTYGGEGTDEASLMRATADGNYILAGRTTSFGSGGIWVLKLDTSGEILWQKVYGPGTEVESLSAIEQTPDGGYILAGTATADDGDYLLMKIDGNGAILWQKRYGGALRDRLTSCVLTPEGGCIVAGESWSFGGNIDFWLMKVAGDGTPVWQKRYGLRSFVPPDHWNDNSEYAPAIGRTGDGYIVSGRSEPLGANPALWIFLIDNSGKITWQRVYPTIRAMNVSSVLQSSDSAYILTGHLHGDDFHVGHDWIMKVDTDGDPLWAHEYGRWDHEFLDAVNALIEAGDGGFVAVGKTRNWKADYSGLSDDAWLLKLFTNGEILDCSVSSPLGVTLAPQPVGEGGSLVVDTTISGVTTSLTAADTTAEAHAGAGAEKDGCTFSPDIPAFVHLPKTGQTTIYHTGDDGDLRAGVTWPSPRFHDNGDGTVTDKLTGLIWLQDANCAQTIGHDPDGAGGGRMQWTSALDFVSAINAGSHPECSAGHSDWRLPNINELGSLVNLGQPHMGEWLNGQGFEHVQHEYGYYWSSTTTADWDGGARQVSMHNGDYPWSWKISSDYVWPVRGGQQNTPDPAYPANILKTGQTTSYYSGDDGDLQYGVAWPTSEPHRFRDRGDGTVTDGLTGLMWLKDAGCFGALDYESTYTTIADFNSNPSGYGCEDYTAHYDDWRLANRTELLSLIDWSRQTPPLPEGHPFVNLSSYAYRTSNTCASPSYMEWNVDMYYYGSPSYSGRTAKPFWLVRGGTNGSICTADLDEDGDVDGMDLAVFAADYGNPACDTGEACAGDVDGDGIVDEEDFAIICREFGVSDCVHQ